MSMLTKQELDTKEGARHFKELQGIVFLESLSSKRIKRADVLTNYGLSKLMCDTYITNTKRENDRLRLAEQLDLPEKVSVIIGVVCEILNIDASAFHNKRRFKGIVMARQMVVFFLRWVTKSSLQDIGKQLIFGDGQNHATVIHSSKIVAYRILTNDRYFMGHFNDAVKMLDQKYGITIDITDESKQPVWYKKVMNSSSLNKAQ